MAANLFAVKRKEVPDLFPPAQGTKPLSNLHDLLSIHPRGPSPKKRSPLSSIKKMLSLTRLNTSNLPCTKDPLPPSNVPSSTTGAQWPHLSPLSPQSTANSSRPSSVLSAYNRASTSTSPTSVSVSQSSCDEPCYIDKDRVPNPEEPPHRTEPEQFELATPVGQKSLLSSWYDDWFEAQSFLEMQRRQAHLRSQPEPRSFFEDDSDDDINPDESEVDDAASEYSYTSIVPDCFDSDSDSDSDVEEDVTVTIGKRVTCRRASFRVFSASSSEDSHSSSRSSTPRIRRAFEIDRSLVENQP